MANMFDEKPDPESGGNEQDSAQQFDAAYVASLRAEAAKYRNKAKEATTQLNELQPLAQKAQELEEANKTEAEKLAQKMADLQKQLDAAQAAAQQATQANQLTSLAAKAGVPADLIPYLDVSKFDLSDMETTTETLTKLVPKHTQKPGSNSNPNRSSEAGEDSPADWYNKRMGGSSSIFGG